MRLIDADAVKEALRNRIGENIDECINNIPTVDIPTVDILDKIRTEIDQMPSELTADGRRMIRRESVIRIIDKYLAESEDKCN